MQKMISFYVCVSFVVMNAQDQECQPRKNCVFSSSDTIHMVVPGKGSDIMMLTRDQKDLRTYDLYKVNFDIMRAEHIQRLPKMGDINRATSHNGVLCIQNKSGVTSWISNDYQKYEYVCNQISYLNSKFRGSLTEELRGSSFLDIYPFATQDFYNNWLCIDREKSKYKVFSTHEKTLDMKTYFDGPLAIPHARIAMIKPFSYGAKNRGLFILLKKKPNVLCIYGLNKTKGMQSLRVMHVREVEQIYDFMPAEKQGKVCVFPKKFYENAMGTQDFDAGCVAYSQFRKNVVSTTDYSRIASIVHNHNSDIDGNLYDRVCIINGRDGSIKEAFDIPHDEQNDIVMEFTQDNRYFMHLNKASGKLRIFPLSD